MATHDYSVENDDAVCFSAGLKGAPFGAGTIHAYLASDRQPPKLAAGISLGALTAAVMERCYRALDQDKSRTETARWGWYRCYLSFLLDRPFDVVWNAIPDPSDFAADMPPVRDPNLPVDKSGISVKVAEDREVQARRKLYLVTRLGSWFVHLPVRVSSIAWLAVRYVRHRERYPKQGLLRIWNFLFLNANQLRTLWHLLLHAARPFWVTEWAFRYPIHREDGSIVDGEQVRGPRWLPIRPLFGWKLWFLAVALVVAAIATAAMSSFFIVEELIDSGRPDAWHFPLIALVAVAPLIAVVGLLLVGRQGASEGGWMDRLGTELLGNLDLDKSLLTDFPLLLKLYQLFAEHGQPPRMRHCRFPVLLVAAPLQILPSPGQSSKVEGPNQLWPDPGSDYSVIRALRACLAASPWFESWKVQGKDIENWAGGLDSKDVKRLDLVDGAVVRHNPLPALIRFLKSRRDLATSLCRPEARIHLVYNVPIRWKPEPPEVRFSDIDDPENKEPLLPNIVETAVDGLRLAHRRDSRLEVIRTNYISQLERTLQECTGIPTVPEIQTITVDEIAPEDDLRLDNQLKPTETEILTHIASGCRQTLSVLYKDELSESTSCWEFLRRRATKRKWAQVPSPGLPGLAEVCRHCTRNLKAPEKPPDNLLPMVFRAGSGELLDRFPRLSGRQPRIVFLASGGVFRGSFHIGMLGAMLALDIKPDMIVGASVGTLMGAALGSIFSVKASCKVSGDDLARKRLQRLANLFIGADARVALTKTFKAAAKDLGIQARSSSLRLSPNELRKMVNRGSRADAGLAATGAPPALIDAISALFMIPYRETANIASDFIAGHFSRAANNFWKQVSKETIDRLGIHDAVLDATLVEKEIRLLLGDDVPDGITDPAGALQPFLGKSGIAFFATTVNLVTESITTLGAELDRKSYDFTEALLASSAFPAAFSPRRASALYPGTGRRDIFYGDGGMFDNLPVLSALEVLGEVQRDRLHNSLGRGVWQDELRHRFEQPDLFIVGSLNVHQDPGQKENFDSVLKSWQRAKHLSDNEKIEGLVRVTEKIDRQLRRFAADPAARLSKIGSESEKFLNGVVNAAVLPVYPVDDQHLNGTFEFCASLGLKRPKVRRSIGDGCFQTLLQIQTHQEEKDSVLGRSLRANKLQRIERHKSTLRDGPCPHFRTVPGAGSIHCPFHEADDNNIYLTCSEDPKHQIEGN
jgi:predicted acylesterase/phospholipase RssA